MYASMDHNTVAGLVTALVSTYDAGLKYYTKWQWRKWYENHYRTQARGKHSGSGSCALSTSMAISGPRIRQSFDSGADILGPGFSVGDEQCREVLRLKLHQMHTRVSILRDAMKSGQGPLDLLDMIWTSEAVRISSVGALSEQYQRVAVSRLVPRQLLSTRSQPEGGRFAPTPEVQEDDVPTVYHTACSTKSQAFQSEPQSPPPTPKIIADDVQSTYIATSESYPKASVFSIFCPYAMKYQVNLTMPMPEYNKRCRCGYEWKGNKTQDKLAMTLKDGFELTPRFLGKSHCADGFGCVLCTSSGKTDTYETVESLRGHINACHDKWQMLHDRDMTALGNAKKTRRW